MKDFWKRKSDRVYSELDLRAMGEYAPDKDQTDYLYFDRNGHSIARIDPDDMNALGVSPNDWIKIMGREESSEPLTMSLRRRTVVRCLPLLINAWPFNRREKGAKIIRTDTLTRNNIKCELGDTVTIRKEIPLLAEQVVLEPIADFAKFPFVATDLDFIADYAWRKGVAICTDNFTFMRGLPQHGLPLIPFYVVSYVCDGRHFLLPHSRSALIVEGTEIVLAPPKSGDENIG